MIPFCISLSVLTSPSSEASEKIFHQREIADAENGRLLWKTAVQAVARNGLVAAKDRVCFSNGKELVCLSLEDGEEEGT